MRNSQYASHESQVAGRTRRHLIGDAGVGLRDHCDDDHRRAQGHHVEVHLQRRRVSNPARQVRTLSCGRRRRADVAAQVQHRCRWSGRVGRVHSRESGVRGDAAVVRRSHRARGEKRSRLDAARARHDRHLGNRRYATGQFEQEAGRCAGDSQLGARQTGSVDPDGQAVHAGARRDAGHTRHHAADEPH